jgi:hypothetical protein
MSRWRARPVTRIELSEQECVVLERRARAEKLPFQDVQRDCVVCRRGNGGHGDRGETRYFAGSGGAVTERRLNGLKDQPRPGSVASVKPRAVVKAVAVRASGSLRAPAVAVLAD